MFMKNAIRLSALFLLLTLCVSSCCRQTPDGEINIDFNKKGPEVSESMYGIFFEEINHSGDGGLYAELVQNRGFEDTSIPEGYKVVGDKIYPPAVCNHLTGALPNENLNFRWSTEEIPAWSMKQIKGSGAKMTLTTEKPLHTATPTALKISLGDAGGRIVVTNSGFWGMNIVKGDKYDLRFYIQNDPAYKGDIEIKLMSNKGAELASERVALKSSGVWNEYLLTIEPVQSDTAATLNFEFEGSGNLLMDYVSLFPQATFNNRPNGLRKDVVKALQDLQPAFIRWPGGCIVEGITLSNRIKWKETLGDPMTRPGVYDTWGYRTTMGFGYHEFLQFSEDMNADGMFVCNVGLGCQGRVGDACPDSELDFFINDALDAIEYAIGDVNTKWGKVRAQNGHPEPFPLKYVEIGNENWGEVYAKRHDIFYKAIKAKYPQLTLISTLGLGGQNSHEKVDMIDPHWYVTPEGFFLNDSIFDRQERGDYKVYVGEYSCNVAVGSGNMLGALGEASYLAGMERNADLVTMTSYAPLLENVNDRVWPVNLIWVDSYRVMGRSSYYVQKMYAENRPDYILNSTLTQPEIPVKVEGKIGLGTWETRAEFKDVVITKADGTVVKVDMNKAADEWKPVAGEWSVKDGAYAQTGAGGMRWSVWEGEEFGNCTIELKAKKTDGGEGFMVFFGVKANDGYMVNIGGWGNSRTAMQKMSSGALGEIPGDVPQQIEADRWYTIKIEVRDGQVLYTCDDDKSLDVKLKRQRRYSVTGFDSKTNEVIVKVVNAEESPYLATINLDGVEVESEGLITTLKADSELDENTMENPMKIAPQQKTYSKFSNSFEYKFEPWSFNILRIKVKK